MGAERFRYVNGRLISKTMKQETNPESPLVPSNMKYAFVPELRLESGHILRHVRVAYTTQGQLNYQGTNAVVVCHALSGNADAKGDWWAGLFNGPEAILNNPELFIICLNVLGSPYGTTSPLTFIDDDPSQARWGPNFPCTSIRDDVCLHKKVLDGLGVRQILMVIGGSMGGMHSLEWAFFGQRYVQRVVVIACSAAQSAWAIAWNEMQRSAIRADTKYLGGYYSLDAPPVDGLAAARMAAMLTYRTHESFQRRFDRNIQRDDGHTQISEQGPLTGEKPMEMTTRSASNNTADRDRMCLFRHSKTLFSAQSYLKYQGSKFNARFDANCYIALTEKLDTHDIARGRVAAETTRRLESALEMLTQPVLVIGIEGDVLYPLEEQVFLYEALPNVYLECIAKDEGHDSFLIQSTTVNKFIARFSAATCFGQPQMVRTGSCDSGINLSGGMVA